MRYFLAMIMFPSLAIAQEIVKPPDFEEQMYQNIVREYCSLPPPEGHGVYYVWENGKCVAKVK